MPLCSKVWGAAATGGYNLGLAALAVQSPPELERHEELPVVAEDDQMPRGSD